MTDKKEFTNIRCSLGLVFRGEIDNLKKLKEIIEASIGKLGVEAIYQRVSAGRLMIKEDSEVIQDE